MSQLFRGSALAAVAAVVAPFTPASAIVYVVTFSGTATENYVETTDASGAVQRTDATGGTFSATFSFDTDALPPNDPDTFAGEDFRYAVDGPWFANTVTFTGGAAPAFGEPATLNRLLGAFGLTGFVELQDDRLLRDDAAANETASLLIAGFDGLAPLPGTAFPDFRSAQNLSFILSNSFADLRDGSNRLTYAAGAVDSVVVGAAPIPEPATWATMALGFGLLGATLRRRRAAVRA